MSALTDLFTAFANKIRSKTGGSDTYTPPQMVNAIDDVYQAGVDAGTTPTQTKTVTAGTSATTVTPDTGYALSSVTVNPTPSQSKSATPTTTAQTITPDSGKLLSSVSVGAIPSEYIIPSGNKSITANGTGIDVKSYATASVNVPNPTLSGDAAVGNVLSGKTFYNSDYTKRTGTMTNNGAVSPTALSAGGSYTVPAGYHNGSGVVSAKTLASQTGVDSGKTAIDASHVHSGYQGWVNGSKVSGTYVAPTINNITPSNSSPASMSSGSNYSPTASGYAISSYDNVTPTTDGTYFSSGMKKMASSGYAYSSQPSPDYSMTLLGSFTLASTSQTSKTLSTSLAGYNYIIISQYALSDSYFGNAANIDNCGVCGAPVDYFKSHTIKMVYRSNNGNGNTVFTYVSDTSMTVKANYSNSRTYYVYGMK